MDLIKIYSGCLEIFCMKRTGTKCLSCYQAYIVENPIENFE